MTETAPDDTPRQTRKSRGTFRQSFRYPPAKWSRFVALAEPNASAILQDFCDWYIGEPKTKMPRRPKPGVATSETP